MFLVVLSLFGIHEVRADEMSVEVVAVTPEPSGMKSLFNGKDLTGWVGDSRLWSVRDGVVHGETTEKNPTSGNTFLIYKGSGDTPEEFGDFELRLSFRCNATNNSGIQYRSEWLTERKNDWVLAGYQHEVRNEIDFPNVSSFIYDEKGKGKRLCYMKTGLISAQVPKVTYMPQKFRQKFRGICGVILYLDFIRRGESIP